MAGKYQAYPEYKDSEVEWIGQIPLHWQTASLSKLFGIKAGGDVKTEFFSDIQTENHLYPIYTNANDEKAVYGYTSKCNYPPNTITVSGRGEVGFATFRDHAYDAIIRLLVLFPIRDSACKFFTYFINEVIDFRVESSAIGQLSTQQISPYKVAFPSLDEQIQIANFLDHETAKIDTLIEKQQQLIKLLKEKRQAVISHAVTKGLNPNVPMRDSGVEWLGEVPEHWEVLPLKYVLKVKKGAVKAGPFGSHLKNSDMEGSDVKVITQKNVISRDFEIGESMISMDKYRELEVFTIERDDILVTTRGTIGRTAIYDSDITAILHPCLKLSKAEYIQNFLH